MNLLPNSLMPIFPVVVMNRWPWRKIMRQYSPRAAGANQVQDSIDNLSHVSVSWSATGLGWWQQWLDQFPLFICQISWVRYSVHILLIGQKSTFHTLSQGLYATTFLNGLHSTVFFYLPLQSSFGERVFLILTSIFCDHPAHNFICKRLISQEAPNREQHISTI